MSFLGALAGAISDSFSLGENTNNSLDKIDPSTGKNVPYGTLGDFAGNFDQSSERRYLEEGYLRIDPFITNPKQLEILMQEPNATVLFKKKQLSSVGDNFRPDFMDADEKLYYRAMKKLFQNKCNQISILEKLSKIQSVTSSIGNLPNQLLPAVFTLADNLNSTIGSSLGGAATGSSLFGAASFLSSTVDAVRRLTAFNQASHITSWITDSTIMSPSALGEGTGVIEITNFTELTTTTTTSLDRPGSFSVTIMDPYECMWINEYDIEKAISDATNLSYNSNIYELASKNSATQISDFQNRLNELRAQRGAGSISLHTDISTFTLGKRVTAIFDRIGTELPFTYDSTSAAAIFSGGALGGGATVAPEYLIGGSIVGSEGLDTKTASIITNNITLIGNASTSELSLFSSLISAVFGKLSADANAQKSLQTANQFTDYARRKLRFNFLGQSIIQPMDTIHVYINSKSRYDNRLLDGFQDMFAGLNAYQNQNNTLSNIGAGLANLGGLNPSANLSMEVEKSVFVGSDFPNYLWSVYRDQFVSENEGTHVFAGLVQNVADSWSNAGKFSVSISGSDNTHYFEQGKINFKPGADVFNGSIFDPLTPFKTNFDTVSSNAKSQTPELLDENQFILGSSQSSGSPQGSSLVKFKLGRFAGQSVNQQGLIQDKQFDPLTGQINKIFYAPDGLVYKWKEGIGVFTQFGSNQDMNDPTRVGNPAITNDPFAGQDIMNVLSLLIVGAPYNFATYYKAAMNFDGAGADPQSKQNAAHSFLQSLRNDLVKTNTLWGNFIPFKNMVMDEASYVKAIQKTTTIINKNIELDAQIKTLQDLNQQAMMQGAASAFSQQSKYNNTDFLSLKSQVSTLTDQIQNTLNSISAIDDSDIQQVGSDTSFDSSAFAGNSSSSLSPSRQPLRRQINFLTRRMSYKVRANEDKNLFIVDDSYDKDYDIAAFQSNLTDGIKLYTSNFTSVKQQIQQVAQLLNLEVFCDSQGHIRCRSPQYNKMPSSVFYKMIYQSQTLGIQPFPDFLTDLFTDQLSSLRSQIEILEDQIRLDCAILSIDTDSDCVSFILGPGGASSGTGSSFDFISDESNGQISEISDLLSAANPDQGTNAQPQALQTFDTISQTATSTQNVFGNSTKYASIVSFLQDNALNSSGIPTTDIPSFLTSDRVDVLVKRIFTKSGQRVDKKDYLVQTVSGAVDVQPPISSSIDVFKVVSELSDKIKNRQKALKTFYKSLNNAQEFNSLNNLSHSTATDIITHGIFNNANVPEVLEHMIEDETYDDYGLNSGQRYVIRNNQIRNITYSANAPPFTSVEVNGVLSPFLTGQDVPPELVGAFPGGGNGLTAAMALDYDMWRNYGFKQAAVLSVPFLSDPVSQCGPYAAMILSRNRKEILQANVTISGNEFMQPGEVVYLENRGLLFYVTSVKHSFTFGSAFTTTLELSYGHTPGEYIPNPVDMIGKMIYNNKDGGQLIIHRQENSGNEQNVGVIQTGPTGSSSNNSLDTNGFTTSYSAQNAQVINNIIYNTQYLINANQTQGNNTSASIQLRIYYDNSNPADPKLISFANSIVDILTGGSSGLNSLTQTTQNVAPGTIPAQWIAPIDTSPGGSLVNLDDTSDRRSPSQKALDAARNSQSSSSFGGSSVSPDPTAFTSKDAIRSSLFKNIVDCWVTITPLS